ncbi:MAG: hypothetical protein A2Y24_08245 [Clostridiales bacterium GWE2_32_10]|nr:MAG: hypothetical protein A2Y24_08245 [Clostridiales bacterium GWE2_32_10]
MIILKNVCKSYNGKQVLKNLNIEIKQNKITCIVGKLGIGKTTLLSVLANLEEIESGEIINYANKVSFVFQRDTLIPNTRGFDNFKYIIDGINDKKALKRLVDEYLKKFEMFDKKYEYKEFHHMI